MRIPFISVLVILMGCSTPSPIRGQSSDTSSWKTVDPIELDEKDATYFRFRKEFKKIFRKHFGRHGLEYSGKVPLYDLKATCEGGNLFLLRFEELTTADKKSGGKRRKKSELQYEPGLGLRSSDGFPFGIIQEEKTRSGRYKFNTVFVERVLAFSGARQNQRGGTNDCPNFLVRLGGKAFGRSDDQSGMGYLEFRDGKYQVALVAKEVR